MEIVELFKALSDESRIRILNILKNRTLFVCDIENILGLSQVNASRHLSKLKNANIIISEKKSQWVYFNINSDLIKKYSFIQNLLDNNMYEQIFTSDIEKLHTYLLNKTQC